MLCPINIVSIKNILFKIIPQTKCFLVFLTFLTTLAFAWFYFVCLLAFSCYLCSPSLALLVNFLLLRASVLLAFWAWGLEKCLTWLSWLKRTRTPWPDHRVSASQFGKSFSEICPQNFNGLYVSIESGHVDVVTLVDETSNFVIDFWPARFKLFGLETIKKVCDDLSVS